jgi:hypothetical protein
MRGSRVTFFSVLAFLTLASAVTYSQQIADPNFDAKAARPAYTKSRPKVLFDEAHNNFHTTMGRYKPFADLIVSDGYAVTPNKEKFTKELLDGYNVLLIANALGGTGTNSPEAGNPAFTEEECDAVRDWVRGGGALLLIADHAPYGAAAETLSLRFGVEMSKGYTSDSANFDPESGNQSFLLFTRDNGLLMNHSITQGRDATERINRVMTFTGQSLKPSMGSGDAFLKLSDTAMDAAAPSHADIQAAIARARAGEGGTPVERLPSGPALPPGATAVRVPPGKKTSAAGRAQAVAIGFGKGRVVVLGEAALLSAQLAAGDRTPFGMNRKGIDNRQLGLNIMHWLSRLLN